MWAPPLGHNIGQASTLPNKFGDFLREDTVNRIKFSEGWDKLKDPQFTTIRSFSPEKVAYYRTQVGREFVILRVPNYWSHRGQKIGTATLRAVRVVTPRDLPAGDLHRDVLRGGKPDSEWMGRLLAMDRALLLEFDNHVGILSGAKT